MRSYEPKINSLVFYLFIKHGSRFDLNKRTWDKKIIQSTPVNSNSKGLTETLRDIRTSTYQSWESEENNKLNNHI